MPPEVTTEIEQTVETPAVPTILDTPTATPEQTIENWHSPEYKQLVDNKKFNNPDAVLKAYSNLEGMIGKKNEASVTLPNDNSTPEQIAEFNKRIGVPEASTDYTYKADEKDNEFLTSMKDIALESGIPDKQFSTFAEKYDKVNDDAIKQMEKDQTSDMNALKKEWGTEYDDNVAKVAELIKGVGLDKELVDEAELAMAKSSSMLKLLKTISGAIGDDVFVSDGGSKAKGDYSKYLDTIEAGQTKTNYDRMMIENSLEVKEEYQRLQTEHYKNT